jgi:L-2,4-diaminobutyrate decarboxylase
MTHHVRMLETRLHESLVAVERALVPYLRASRRGEGPVIVQPPVAEIAEALQLRKWIRDGGMGPQQLEDFVAAYLQRTTRVHHPGSLAHQVAVPDVPAAMADLIHGITNNPMAIYEMGPAAAAIEVEVIDWMLGKIGFDPSSSGGVLTHGGSLANLTALLAARGHVAPESWSRGVPVDLAILAAPSAHYSIARAAGILGLGQDAVIALDTDALERIDPTRIGDAVRRARDAGRRAFALVAAACATSTGLHDDLRAAASACEKHGLWLHVDAAHGGSALLSPSHRRLLAGIERADSVTWDAHKLMQVSGLCAAVLLRDQDTLNHAFHQQASYLFYDRDTEGVDLMAHTVECTKAALGLKLFLELAARGEQGLGADVAARYELTRRAHALISARPGFDCPYVPESNILCFRFGEDDELQLALRERLIAQGDAHLSSALVGGRRYLRMTITAPATTEATIAQILDAIETEATTLTKPRTS